MTFVSGLFMNGTQMPADFDYNDPPLPYVINGRQDPTSQRFTVAAALIRQSLADKLGRMHYAQLQT
jgi:hypothetical protein